MRTRWTATYSWYHSRTLVPGSRLRRFPKREGNLNNAIFHADHTTSALYAFIPRPLRDDSTPTQTAVPLENRPHIPALDGLRGACISLVLVGHVAQFSFGQQRWGEWAALGVLFFFLLSGFLITTVLLHEKLQSGQVSLRAFYSRRALRILPAALVFLTTLALLVAVGWITDVSGRVLAASVFFVRNFAGPGASTGHLWSLSIEEQFYLAWPFVLTRLDRRQAFITSTCLIVGCWIWRMGAIGAQLYPYDGATFYMRTDFRIDSILVGCWVAIVWSEPTLRERLRELSRRIRPWVFLPALGCWSFYAERFAVLWPVYLTVQTILASSCFVWVLFASVESPAYHLLSHRYAVWLGRLSYSLYLWQQILLVTQAPDWGQIRYFPNNVIMTFVVALASYYLIEQPALQLKRRYGRTRQDTSAMVLAA